MLGISSCFIQTVKWGCDILPDYAAVPIPLNEDTSLYLESLSPKRLLLLTSNLSPEFAQEISRLVSAARLCAHCVIVSSILPESDIAEKELSELLRRTIRPLKCDLFPVAKSCIKLIEPSSHQVCLYR